MVQKEFFEYLNELAPKDGLIRFCSQAIPYFFYALIFFIPISTALVEWFATLPFIFFLIIRIRAYVSFKDKYLMGYSPYLKLKYFIRSLKPVRTSHDLFIWIWVLISLFSIIISGNHGVGWKAFGGKVMQNVFVFWLFIEFMNGRKKQMIALGVLSAAVLLISLNGVYQHFGYPDFLRGSEMVHGRISSSLREPTDFAAYLVLTVPVVFALTFSGLFHASIYGEKRLMFNITARQTAAIRTVVYSALGSGILAMGWTYSRAGWGALLIALSIIVFCRKLNMKIYFGSVLVILGAFIYLMSQERQFLELSRIFSPTGRGVYWQEAVNMIKANPLSGVGLNAYSISAEDYKITWGGYPHNCYLHMAAEIGIPGAIVFIIFLGRLLLEAFNGLKRLTNTVFQSAMLGLLAGFSAFLIHSFFDTFFYSAQLGTFMWLIMGWIVLLTVQGASAEA